MHSAVEALGHLLGMAAQGQGCFRATEEPGVGALWAEGARQRCQPSPGRLGEAGSSPHGRSVTGRGERRHPAPSVGPALRWG